MRRSTLWVFVFTALLAAGCSGSTDPGTASGIRGSCEVTYLPGVQPPPDIVMEPPKPQPFAGVIIRAKAGGTVVGEATTGAAGTFQLALKPGSYQLEVAQQEERTVEVRRGEFSELNYHFVVGLP